ncbi:ABC transporter substrate-binding protein [Paenibacillus sp. OSY-SE]|uniref:ABC transporter substrate-binding protein n=1 Tax=Paenibacillus sp. OSY-SE TaxID=1196323 RepID=UPI0002F8C4B8|nr:ABC transporter substrate-binding protein [Paenibacillus sp. OSY-SE]
MILEYLEFRAYLYDREVERKAAFLLHELATIWRCSVKNAKRKLKKLTEQRYCSYTPGRGRGNRSEVQFFTDFRKELHTVIRQYLNEKDLKRLMHVLQLPFPQQWIDDLRKPIQEQLGLQTSDPATDVLHAIITQPVTAIDPARSSITFDQMLVSLIGDTLLQYDADKDELLPHLAIAWEADDRYEIWTIFLRKRILFHHHRTLTSADVKYSLERLQQASCANRWLAEDIAWIHCLSPLMVRINLRQSNPLFGRYLASAPMTIVPADAPIQDKHFIGTGAYKITECTESKVVLEAFDDYFKERPFIDAVQFWKVPPEKAQLIAYRITMDDGQPGPALQENRVEHGFRFVMFNTKHVPLMRDRELRLAINELFAMDEMWRDLDRSGLVHASHFFPWKSKPIKRSLGTAKQWLQNSCYNGETLHVYTLDLPEAWAEAVWFQQQAARIGLNMMLHPYSFNELYDRSMDEDIHIIFSGEVSSLDPHLSFLGAFYNDALAFRRFIADNHMTSIDKKLKKMKLAPAAEREQLIDEVVQYMHKEMLIVFMHHPLHQRTFDPMLQHIQYDTFTFVDLKKLWIRPSYDADTPG